MVRVLNPCARVVSNYYNDYHYMLKDPKIIHSNLTMYYWYCKGQSAGNQQIYYYFVGSSETTRDTPYRWKI